MSRPTMRCAEPGGSAAVAIVASHPPGVAALMVRFDGPQMNKAEAQKVLGEQLDRFKQRSYSELAPLVDSGRVENFEVRVESGTAYQVEVQFFWDDKPRGAVRVIGSIDDGGIRAFAPLTQAFLVTKPVET